MHNGKEGMAMSNYTSNKVISLNSLGRDRSPGQRILGECRDQLEEGLTVWLRDVATPISEELFVLADSTRERIKQTRYLDLRADIEKDWQQLIEAFRRELSAETTRCLNKNNQDNSNREAPLEIPDFEGLTLVADEDLSENIVIREFAAQLSETCNTELYSLDRRVAALLGQDEPVDHTNPLAPPIICQALTDACAALGSDAEDRLLLLRRLERHLHLALPPIYQQINARLVERGILPDLKRDFRRSNPTSGTGAPSSPYASSASSGMPVAQGAPGDAAALGGEGILGALQRLVQARSTNQGLPSIPNEGTIQSGIPGAMAGSAVGLATGQNAGPAPDAAALSQMFFVSLDQLQHLPIGDVENIPVNRVRAVRESEAARQIGHLESVTIDIVAMLFDFIFDDRDIPPAIKALVSRLQIPVLKVAMLDSTFFSDRQHPARRFLGSISGIAVRWGSAVDETDPFYCKLAELVEHIQNEFETDVKVFGTALAVLDVFVKQRENEEESTVLTATDLVIRHEQEASAWERAQHAVQTFWVRPLPALIEAFVSDHWIYALQKVALEHDADSPAWKSAVGAMEDLDWSIQPKKSQEDRLKLISMLPRLLGQLNKGLDSIDADPAQRRAFFDELVECHSAALKGDMAGLSPEAAALPKKPKLTPPPSTDQEGDLLVTRSVDNGVEVEEIILVGASPIWRASDREAFARVGELKRGDWLEFRQEDGSTSRERLNWISPQRGILVFSNHRSAKAISISPEALARQLRDGNASIVSGTPLFERALSGVLETLNAS
jgi:hypothetical protein